MPAGHQPAPAALPGGRRHSVAQAQAVPTRSRQDPAAGRKQLLGPDHRPPAADALQVRLRLGAGEAQGVQGGFLFELIA